MNTSQLWGLDEGKTYRCYVLNQIETFKKLRKGRKVKLTVLAIGGGISKKHHFGRFMGSPRDKDRKSIRVKPDGLKTTSTYWIGFWQPVHPK